MLILTRIVTLLNFMPGPMKARKIIFILSSFVASSILVYLLSDQQPTLHTIVSETHKQLNNLKNLKDNLKATERKELTTNEKYLKALGFIPEPRQYPTDLWVNTSLPVIVTAVAPGQVKQALGFITSARHHVSDKIIIMYDLGLGEYELTLINQHCNSSSCFIRKFNFDYFPSHVNDISIKAYRPLLIQEMLNLAGAVFWLDINFQLISNKLDGLQQQASSVGLAAWTINQPTSVLTHPKMFEYFHATQQNFYFHRMAEPDHIMLYNTVEIHKNLMLPWVQCSLTLECIAPIGAQGSGCRFDKKPLYRYSGCHRYDMSAFNVALGVMFNFVADKYTTYEKLSRIVEEFSSQDGFNESVISNSHEEYTR